MVGDYIRRAQRALTSLSVGELSLLYGIFSKVTTGVSALMGGGMGSTEALASLSSEEYVALYGICSKLLQASQLSESLSGEVVAAASPLLLEADRGVLSLAVRRSDAETESYEVALPGPIAEFEEFKCAICLKLWDRPTVTPCRHIFCVECILRCLLKQSMCPLCRAAVYVSTLTALPDHTQFEMRRLYDGYCRLPVECPKCSQQCTMSEWPAHSQRGVCEQRLAEPQEASTGVSSDQDFDTRQLETRANEVLPGGANDSETKDEGERRCSRGSDSSGAAVGNEGVSSTDRLVAWLEQQVKTVTGIYLIQHRLENTMGAAGGFFVSDKFFNHTQVVLELRELSSEDRENEETDIDALLGKIADSNNGRDAPNHVCPQTSTYLSLEITVDRKGVQWASASRFPRLRPSARAVAVHEPVTMTTTQVCEFIRRVGNRDYNLVRWNCQTFAKTLLHEAKASETAKINHTIPRPKSFSRELMKYLTSVVELGEVPTVAPVVVEAELDANPCPPIRPVARGHGKGFLGGLRRLLYDEERGRNGRGESESPTPSSQSGWPSSLRSLPCSAEATREPSVRIASAMMCLFPAEDRDRRLLGAAAAIIRHTAGKQVLSESASTSSSSPGVERYQVELRCDTLPVLIFELQSTAVAYSIGGIPDHNALDAEGNEWRTIGFMSLEFRSDYGLCWHMYPRRPSGPLGCYSVGGTEMVVSSSVNFLLTDLLVCLESISEWEYDTREWCGWDFAHALLEHCCPEKRDFLTSFPMAEL